MEQIELWSKQCNLQAKVEGKKDCVVVELPGEKQLMMFDLVNSGKYVYVVET